MKNIIKILSVFIVLIVILYFVFASGNKAKPPTIKIGYTSESFNYATIMVASEEKLFEKNNVEVDLVPFKSSSESRLALATGKIDLAFLSLSETLMAIDNGAPMRLIAPVARSSTVVFVRPDGPTKLSDLKGKTIEGAAGTSRLEFVRAMSKEGFKPSDFNFVDIDSDYREIALLKQKTVDATPTSRYKQENLIKAGAVRLAEWEEKYGKTFSPHTFLVANTNYMEKNLDQVGNVVDVLFEAQKQIKTNPSKSAELVIQHIGKNTDGVVKYTSSQVLQGWEDSVHVVIWSDPAEISEVVNLMYENKELKKQLTLDQIFDFRLRGQLEHLQELLDEANI